MNPLLLLLARYLLQTNPRLRELVANHAANRARAPGATAPSGTPAMGALPKKRSPKLQGFQGATGISRNPNSGGLGTRPQLPGARRGEPGGPLGTGIGALQPVPNRRPMK